MPVRYECWKAAVPPRTWRQEMQRGTALRNAAITLLLLALVITGCRNEAQNRIRRNIQEFSNTRMYITLYSRDGQEVFTGLVDGKVTRASAQSASGDGAAAGTRSEERRVWQVCGDRVTAER